MRAHGVRSLLMGGQACILYGAAEFSRDTDVVVLASPDNLRRLQSAMTELEAAVVAVPPFEVAYLQRGHAVHFRCSAPDVQGLRIDVMARLRGVDPFEVLWDRRTTITLPMPDGPALDVELLALPDLVAAKKTQRDKDWPMLRRLVEANYFQFRDAATPARIGFWLRELRTPELLLACAEANPAEARAAAVFRPALAAALAGDLPGTARALDAEQVAEQAVDRAYWAPLRTELEGLRRSVGG